MLGQSFGGFCTTTYLSFAPEGLREALIAGGLPGLDATADDVYRVTYPIVAERNRRHYERFPMDADRARAVARHLASHEVIMPGGGRLTVPAFQSLGRMLGAAGGSDTLHYLLEDAFTGGRSVCPTRSWPAPPPSCPSPRRRCTRLVHEACYAQGTATRWAADRIMAEFPEFDPAAAVDGDITLLFTGEMIYPWMFETDPVLRPLRDAAEELAQRDSWPRLYDPARLAATGVPAAAAVYYEDMYVPLALLGAHRPRDPRPAALDHERVRARRAGQQQRRGAGPAHRAGPRHRLMPPPDAAPADRRHRHRSGKSRLDK